MAYRETIKTPDMETMDLEELKGVTCYNTNFEIQFLPWKLISQISLLTDRVVTNRP